VAEEVQLHKHLSQLLSAARKGGYQVFFSPHRRWRPGDYDTWKYPNPSQIGSGRRQMLAAGTWGGDWHPGYVPGDGDVVVQQHWAQSGFANTDLDLQLKQHGIDKIILIGMLANTCIESTARYGMELGYHVTLVTDATAAMSQEAMHAAHEVNGPSYAHNIVTTAKLLALLQEERC